MTFSEYSQPVQIDNINPTWEYIESSLNKLDPINKAYFILTNEFSSYIQCAGSKEKLTIEFRKFDNSTFKHYVIGKRKSENISAITWDKIECKIGPIFIHDNEVLNIENAIEIFNTFYNQKDIPLSYNQRNITKQFPK